MNTINTPLYFNERVLGNDLTGELSGTVLFAQASVLPSRASPIPGDVQPRLVGRRDALVLFKPTSGSRPLRIQLKIGSDQTAWVTVGMNPPEKLPPVTERDSDSEYARIAYGEQFWSAVVSGELIRPGNDLVFEADGRFGTYKDLNVGAPSELLLHTIDIGMLTPYRSVFTDTFTPELQREYFQTLPCSRLIVNQYEPIHFQFIEFANGTAYHDHSAGEGGYQSGDMRERIGKQLVSLGINNANLGIHASPGSGEGGLNKHFVVAQLAAHTSVGNYINGRVIHGGSGGGSMVTLQNIAGNEFSHELGHNYGFSHDPGGFAGSVHRAADALNSAWGWDSDKNVFIPNFLKNRTDQDQCHGGQCQPPFHGHRYGRDSMSGGAPMYPATNRYTQYTPYVQTHTQRFLENQAVFSDSSPTGLLKWDESARAMQPWSESHLAGADEWDLASMTALFSRYRRVEVDLHDGAWAQNIHLPNGSVVGRGKEVQIIHRATKSSTLHLNGRQIELKRGDVLRYESTGILNLWVQVEVFSSNVTRKPDQQGVAVATVLGFYDPEVERGGIVYPALHAAYGMTYAGEPSEIALQARCYAMVTGQSGERLFFVLASTRMNRAELNRFHINIPQAFKPMFIHIFCDGVQNASRSIDPPNGTARVTITGGS